MLVMRLETAAAKLERNRQRGDIDTADLVDLLKEAARRIKRLESGIMVEYLGDLTDKHPGGGFWFHETHACGND